MQGYKIFKRNYSPQKNLSLRFNGLPTLHSNIYLQYLFIILGSYVITCELSDVYKIDCITDKKFIFNFISVVI